MSDIEPEPAWLGFPDVVLAGAARSGTSNLAATLCSHPDVDGGAVKEPEYFSRRLLKGSEWYDRLYEPRRRGLLRLDASVSYTSPHFGLALRGVAEAAPHATVLYAVRDPLIRAVSHFRLLSQYFLTESSQDFGAAIKSNPVYLGASDYEHWLDEIYGLFSADQVLVVPFGLITAGSEVTDVIFGRLGLTPVMPDAERSKSHQNEVVVYRSSLVLRARRRVRSSGAYPWLRSRLGPDRMRRLRKALTRQAPMITPADALASCDDDQRQAIEALVSRSREAVSARLRDQDRRLGLDWEASWRSSFT